MRKVESSLFLLFLVAAGVAQGQKAAPLIGQYVRITVPGALVYPDSSILIEPVLRPVPGATFLLLERSAGWYAVLLHSGGKGWIPSEFAGETASPVIAGEETGGRPASLLQGEEFGGALTGAAIADGVGALMLTMSFAWFTQDLGTIFNPHSGGSGVPSETQSLVFLGGCTAFLVSPAVAAYGAQLAGEKHRPAGGFWQACGGGLIGGIAGGAAGFGLGALLEQGNGNGIGLLVGVGGTCLGTALGTASGYNLSRPRAIAGTVPQSRWRLPELGMRVTESGPGRTSPELSLRLLGYRF